jgi:putative acetyltransferase
MLKIEIKPASTPGEFLHAKALIQEYVTWLGFDLAFQNLDAEMADLAKMYNPADGGLFIAYLNHQPVGVAGLRKFHTTEAEVKRMYVTDSAKGLGIGKQLLRKCIETAKTLGYKSIKLDTAAFMKAAIKLYTDQGFVEIDAYRFNPHDHARYFELDLINRDR